jgi:hypothetical protein
MAGLIGMLTGQAQSAGEAQMLHNGDLVIKMDPESHQIIFSIAEKEDANPIVFDLDTGTILNAQFPAAPPPTV